VHGAQRQVKTALDETRLLILGSQILFGFQFNGMFQDGFDRLSGWSRGLDATGFFLMALTIGCLIAPSMQHQLVEQGHDSVRMVARTPSGFTESAPDSSSQQRCRLASASVRTCMSP
jgi:Family of unknown function (DUF6328)